MSAAISASRSAVSGVSSDGLRTHGVAGGERGAELPRGHVERVVPRRDATATTPSGSRRRIEVWSSMYSPAAWASMEAGRPGEEAQVVDGEVDLELDDRHGLADVVDLEPRPGRPAVASSASASFSRRRGALGRGGRGPRCANASAAAARPRRRRRPRRSRPPRRAPRRWPGRGPRRSAPPRGAADHVPPMKFSLRQVGPVRTLAPLGRGSCALIGHGRVGRFSMCLHWHGARDSSPVTVPNRSESIACAGEFAAT